MACSGIYILDPHGQILIMRNYRGDLLIARIKKVIQKVIHGDEEKYKQPIIEDEDGITYAYIQHKGLYFVAATKLNSNMLMIIQFLYKLVQVFQDYFGDVDEESIRDNFIVIHQLLDEMMDFGFPQFSESKILQEYINSEVYKPEKQEPKTIPMAVTGKVSWRSDGIIHNKNELFVDVIEEIRMVVNSTGRVINSEIIGKVNIISKLSGMPTVHFGLSDNFFFLHKEAVEKEKAKKKIEVDDVKLHSCVKYSLVECVTEKHPGSRIEYLVKVRSFFREKFTARNVHVYIPVLKDADSPKIKTTKGKCIYAPKIDSMDWNIKAFSGKKEYLLRAHFGLSSFKGEPNDEKRPVTVEFEIPGQTVSGMVIKYLKVHEKSGYEVLPWVRYLTCSIKNSYEIRI
ncbi:adaptor protein complex 1 mu subunit [Anaeramoeba ignava]|uniref:Adaptor protein complex 1 mu subunit n=1 Tax=Anaeramoeba ignava TaxID=1746090 RepID=A0A9Q0R8Z3_ANAIG|nr:adaptor protein complex 1 mu subunit [Anaeramoeba ignava]